MRTLRKSLIPALHRLGLLPLLLAAIGAATAWAADGSELSETGFRPASEVQKETVNGGMLLIIAYAVVWLLIAGYVFVVGRRARRINQELDAVQLLARDLDARLDEAERRP